MLRDSPPGGAEMDPLGADAHTFKPPSWPAPASAGKLEPYYGIPDLNSPFHGCVVDWVPTDCDTAAHFLAIGFVKSGYVDPISSSTARRRAIWVPKDTSYGVSDLTNNTVTIYSGSGGEYVSVDEPGELESSIKPQSPALAERSARLADWAKSQVAKNYSKCLGKLGKALAPGQNQAADILWVSALEGVDATVIAVSWRRESTFSYNPVSNYRPGDQGWDVGPLQTATTYYNRSPFTDGLFNPFGTVFSETQSFNGNPQQSLIVGARALAEIVRRSRGRADVAGLYRAGSRKPASYGIRTGEFNQDAPDYDAFFNCLRQ